MQLWSTLPTCGAWRAPVEDAAEPEPLCLGLLCATCVQHRRHGAHRRLQEAALTATAGTTVGQAMRPQNGIRMNRKQTLSATSPGNRNAEKVYCPYGGPPLKSQFQPRVAHSSPSHAATEPRVCAVARIVAQAPLRRAFCSWQRWCRPLTPLPARRRCAPVVCRLRRPRSRCRLACARAHFCRCSSRP